MPDQAAVIDRVRELLPEADDHGEWNGARHFVISARVSVGVRPDGDIQFAIGCDSESGCSWVSRVIDGDELESAISVWRAWEGLKPSAVESLPKCHKAFGVCAESSRWRLNGCTQCNPCEGCGGLGWIEEVHDCQCGQACESTKRCETCEGSGLSAVAEEAS